MALTLNYGSKRYNADFCAWQSLCGRVRVCGALPVWFAVLDDTCKQQIQIKMSMTVPERETGLPFIIETIIEPPYLATTAARMAWLREKVHWFYRHECDEQFLFDDTRPFFPEHEHAQD